jgi:hypothetical protein
VKKVAGAKSRQFLYLISGIKLEIYFKTISDSGNDNGWHRPVHIDFNLKETL